MEGSMPSATRELHDKMEARFGSIDLLGPLDFLKSRGFTEKSGLIMPPSQDYKVDEAEGDCIDFLFHEWDFAYGRL
jgi:hypothetical protein